MFRLPEPKNYSFKRVTTEYFHAAAKHENAALARLKLEPGRYQLGFHEEEWFVEKEGIWYPTK